MQGAGTGGEVNITPMQLEKSKSEPAATKAASPLINTIEQEEFKSAVPENQLKVMSYEERKIA